jgi:AcrR family transcriptional regulator
MSSTGPQRPGAGDSEAGPGRAKPQLRARATRRAILTAAAEHFARDGYHGTSLDSVLADSGGTKGALYFHFASKEALARAVIEEMVRQWADLRTQVLSRGLDPLWSLLALVDEVVARLISDPIARGGTRLLSDLPLRPQDVHAHYGAGERDALALLSEAARAGLLREGIEPDVVARQIVAVIAGHRQICDALNERHSLWQRIDEAWTILLPAIAQDSWVENWRASGWAARTRPPVSPTPR